MIYESYIGKTMPSKSYGYFKVLGLVSRDKWKEAIMNIQFIDTGYEYSVPLHRIKTGSVKDPFKPKVFEVGYLGCYNKEDISKYYRLWTDMLRRCYKKSYKEYVRYGAKGISVATQWHNFSTFAKDVPKLPGFDYEAFMAGALYLDKDKLSGSTKIYSKDTCCFLTAAEQSQLLTGVNAPIDFIAISPANKEFKVKGVRTFARENSMFASDIWKCLNGSRKTCRGWKFRLV